MQLQVISLNSESEFLELVHAETVEQTPIKKDMCDVMEGGEQAFDMRYKRNKEN